MPTPTSAELDAIKDLFDARFDGVNDSIKRMENVIERLALAVERQAEQTVALAILTTRFNNHVEHFDSHKTAINAALNTQSRRLNSVEKTATKTSWRVGAARAVAIGAIAFLGEILAHNTHTIWNFFTGA